MTHSPRHNWTRSQALEVYQLPFLELLDKARAIHKQNFAEGSVQLASLYNIKTGACPEDCGYCSQSRHHKTDIKKEKLVPLEKTLQKAKKAKQEGATRFCMGAAWRSPNDAQLKKVCQMITAVKDMGLETCATLGMLTLEQAKTLKESGLDYYNHNLDTSERFYPQVTTTRTYQDRLETLQHVRDSGLKVCCGGILGMGELIEDRIDMLVTLANLNPQPESVPINQLAIIEGTRLQNAAPIEEAEYIKIIALARVMMPKSYVRLSAGRESLTASAQTLCFLAGANSMFLGPKLLTTTNPSLQTDQAMMKHLGLNEAT